MDQVAGSSSFTLFGIRVDCAAPVHTTATIWESALSRGGMRVVLTDMWALLMAQRDFAMWEALSAAEFVLPLGDDPIIRRVAARQHLPVTRADSLLFDLFDAAAGSRKRVVIVAPSDELHEDLALLRQVWPELQVTGQLSGEVDDSIGDRELVRAVNAVGPELLVLGGGSPWQEGWSHAHREDLEIGAVVLLPTLHPPLAAMAQRAGKPVAGVGLLRRKAAIRRAFSTTIRPMASASAETVGAWLQEAREGLADWSATLHAGRPSPFKQLTLPAPGPRSVSARVRPGRAASESSSHWAGIAPLARLGPPRPGADLPVAAMGGPQASATQHASADPTSDLGRAPEREAKQGAGQIVAASGPSAPPSALAAPAASSAVYGRRGRQVEPQEASEPPATSNASSLLGVVDERQYWAEQSTTALTIDQLSAAARERSLRDASSLDGSGVRPPAPHHPAHPAAEASAQDEHGEQSPAGSDSYDDGHLLVFDAQSPVDWTAFLAAEEGHDELPPTTKLDPGVVLESSRGVPRGVPSSADLAPTQRLRPPEPAEPDAAGEGVPAARENHEIDPTSVAYQGGEQERMESATSGGPVGGTDAAAAAPGPGHDGARNEGSREATAGSSQPKPVKVRIVTRYTVRRSRRRLLRERRFHRRLKSRPQG